MGEVVVSGEKVLEVKEMGEIIASEGEGSGSNNNGLMRWEKFLPKMVLRVLLVEADDSTRQIIAALLRKCSYRVAAVPDGLKAWEILKASPHNIDIILTEDDLPSISGYALLTLIMEHDICKNIPVIMMSSQDSISTVYKCMLRGAADYLVKPLRRNELRNLWQHVWRRQSVRPSITGVNGPQDESVAQQKVEATAENNAPGNHSSGDAACFQRNKELIEKGSDAQSSCTKPDLEAESTAMDHMHEFSQLRRDESYPTGTKMQDVEKCCQLGHASIVHDNHAGVCGKNGDPEQSTCPATGDEACDNVQMTCSKEAIDLIGAFQNHPNYSHRISSVDCTGKFDFSPQLDLSLRRSYPSNFENEAATEERHTLTHSDASAFKRYTNRKIQVPPAVFVNCYDQEREQRRNYEKNISNIVGYNSDSSTPSMQRSIASPATPQSKESELTTSPSQRRLSLPIPVKGIRYNDPRAAYGSVLPPPMFCTQSSPSSTPSPNSVPHLKPTLQVNAFYHSNIQENGSEQIYEPHGQKGNPTNQIMSMQEHKLEHVEDTRHISPAVDQSACSNSNVDQAAIVREATEGKNEDITVNESYHRSILREAALNKFRMKRKERCFEKKVRYESRKKLAEQRPRVKGQFVRQVHLDPQATEKDG